MRHTIKTPALTLLPALLVAASAHLSAAPISSGVATVKMAVAAPAKKKPTKKKVAPKKKSPAKKAAKKSAKRPAPRVRTLAGGLKIQDLKVGTGATARNGTTVRVHYRGTLLSGKQFDASYDRGEPFEFSLPGQVIDGWNQGIPGMKVGGKRKLIIPAALAYGEQSPSPDIPANSTLVFVVELLGVS